MTSNVLYMYPGATPRSKMYEKYDFMKPLQYVLVWYIPIMMLYDVIMWHRLYDTWRVYDASSEWRRMMRTPRMNPYAACMYVVCMCLNDTFMKFLSVWCTCRMRRMSSNECCMKPYDVNMNEWRFREQMTGFRDQMRSFPREKRRRIESKAAAYA